MDIKRSRTTTLLATTAAAGAVALTGLAGTAQARCVTDTGDPCPPPVAKVGKVVVAPGQTLGVRPVPRQNARQVRQLANGAPAFIVCQTTGSKVSGTFGTSRIWNKLRKGGYVSDAYVRTGHDGFIPGAPRC